MKPETTIFRIKHGSHMYGTNTPSSDLDYKAVHLPAGRDIVLQKAVDAIDYSREKAAGEKNNPDDVDLQSFAVHKAFDMLMGGDIIGMELMFAPMSSIEIIHPAWLRILDHKDAFLSRKVDGYVGYCRAQVNKYGIRGSRVAAVRAFSDFFFKWVELSMGTQKLSTIADQIEELVDKTEHSSIMDIEQKGVGKYIRHLEVCNRKAPYTIKIIDAYHMYKNAFDEYGARSLAAEQNEGIDWKAISHAVRVGNQAIELLQTGSITFPRPNADYLLKVKLGQIDFKVVSEELDQLLTDVVRESGNSSLPEHPDRKAVEELLVELYAEQVR